MNENIKTTETIGFIFEGYKELCNQEMPMTEPQELCYKQFDQLISQLRKNMTGTNVLNELCFARDTLARESEKEGFILGFKMAMNLMSECLG